jgi:signal recognition particle GTPase
LPRSWAELLGEENAQPEPEAERSGLFSRLRDSLSKSRQALTAELASAAFDPGDTEAWERLEESLIRADVGVPATAELVLRLEARPDLTDLDAALAEEIARLLGDPPTLNVHANPSVLLVVGVNGTGKTTTIGKLAERLRQHGHSWCSARPTPFVLRPRSSWRSGRIARTPSSLVRSAARIRRQSPMTPSRRRRGTDGTL